MPGPPTMLVRWRTNWITNQKDRELLQAFALTTNAGLICDMGCSTGYICLPNGSELLLLTELSNDPLLCE